MSGTELGDGLNARERMRERLDPVGAEPVELRAAVVLWRGGLVGHRHDPICTRIWEALAMAVYMRAVLSEWHVTSLDYLAAFVAGRGAFRVRPVDDRG